MALSSGLKQPGREADYLSPTSTEDKKMWFFHSPILFHGAVLSQFNTWTNSSFVFFNLRIGT
jgi:hypothetical protein